MVVLKKVKASTLMETLVATVLIVLLFMLASLILNNLFSNTINHNTSHIDTVLNELEYQCQNKNLQLPYYDATKGWTISIEKQHYVIQFEAFHKDLKKNIVRTQFETP